MTTPLQKTLPYDPVAQRALPGIQPLPPEEWLITDEAYEGQMALRDTLLANHRDKVLALDESAREAALELLDLVLERAYPGAADSVTRPDGVTVPIDRDDPLGTIGRLIQEDVNILQKQGDEHVLTGGVMCFPASWTLSEKFMRPMVRIHKPATVYDENIAKRVQRLPGGQAALAVQRAGLSRSGPAPAPHRRRAARQKVPGTGGLPAQRASGHDAAATHRRGGLYHPYLRDRAQRCAARRVGHLTARGDRLTGQIAGSECQLGRDQFQCAGRYRHENQRRDGKHMRVHAQVFAPNQVDHRHQQRHRR